jgi:hypothetical protein
LKTFYGALRQTIVLEIAKQTVGHLMSIKKMSDKTIAQGLAPPK